MNHYFMKLSARVRCGWCEEKVLVEVSEEIDCNQYDLPDLDAQIAAAIRDQQEEDGWGFSGKYCWDCMTRNSHAINDQERADDYELEDLP
jgi:hypothetical protein